MNDLDSEARVVIVGGGNAGIALAARLRRMGLSRISIIEPKDTHTYRPLLTYAGAGLSTPTEYQRSQSSVTPRGVRWISGRVESVEPGARVARLEDGQQVPYDHLVICAGSAPDWDATPGLASAMDQGLACSIYLPELVESTWERIRSITHGHAVFTVPQNPAPCPQIGLKFLLLACDYWRTQGVLKQIKVSLITPTSSVYGIEDVDRELEPWVRTYGIEVITESTVDHVDVQTGSVTITTQGQQRTLPIDLLHHVPTHTAPEWITQSGLSAGNGYVEVDPETLQHRSIPTVWACGDAADAECSPSGGALRKQVPVVASNLLSALQGNEPQHRYDGYSVTPIIVERGRSLLAEFDRNNRLTPSIPGIPLITPRRWLWAFDRYVQPRQYWNLILKGK